MRASVVMIFFMVDSRVAGVAAPDGDYAGTIKDGATTSLTAHGSTNDSASLVGEYSARSVQNGQFISGNDGTTDQTTTPGSRAALIQGYLGHTK
jgi:hypothetical protein